MKIDIQITTQRDQGEIWSKQQDVRVRIDAPEGTANHPQPTQGFVKELTAGVQKIAADVAGRL